MKTRLLWPFLAFAGVVVVIFRLITESIIVDIAFNLLVALTMTFWGIYLHTKGQANHTVWLL